MPQNFAARLCKASDVQVVKSGDGAASTFWMRAQNLNRSDSFVSKPGFMKAILTKLCGFCEALFGAILDDGDTKCTMHQSGLEALRGSSKYCSLCAFYVLVISQRCGESVFRDGHEFTVYTRLTTIKQASASSFLNVGFQVKGRCMLAMMFCPDSKKCQTSGVGRNFFGNGYSNVKVIIRDVKGTELAKGHLGSWKSIHQPRQALFDFDS
ncbi:hypothetical protein BKA63DRAFT_497625 [Paraphoma chrysanthemicola]|nr:hypothetical protein BKA63DRAFT_497625 [Paraphoma chrysanthemicola]